MISVFYAPFLYAELERVTLVEAGQGASSSILGQSYLSYSAIADLISARLPQRYTLVVPGARGRLGEDGFAVPCGRFLPSQIYRILYSPDTEVGERNAMEQLKRLAIEERWDEFSAVLFQNFGALPHKLPSVQSLFADAATFAAGIELFLSEHKDLYLQVAPQVVAMVQSGSVGPVLRIANQANVPESLALAAWVLLYGRKGGAQVREALAKEDWAPLEQHLWTPIADNFERLDAYLDMHDVLRGESKIGPQGRGRPSRRSRRRGENPPADTGSVVIATPAPAVEIPAESEPPEPPKAPDKPVADPTKAVTPKPANESGAGQTGGPAAKRTSYVASLKEEEMDMFRSSKP